MFFPSKGSLSTRLVLVLLVCFGLFAVAEARTVVRTGEEVTVAEDQQIAGDFYGAGNIINLSGEVTEDLIVAGGIVTTNGTVGKDATVVGWDVNVHGAVGDDARVVGGTITIAEPITGDLLIVGGTVEVLSTASVGGDVILFAGDARILGSVGGDVFGQVGNLRIDAPVAGAVDVTVDSLVLGDRAAIEGAVTYESPTLITRAQNTVIGGDLVRNDPVVPVVDRSLTIESFLIPVLMLLFAGAFWFLVAKRQLQLVVQKALASTPRPFIVGMLTSILMPFAIGILIMSVLGAPIGFVLLFSYLALFVLSGVGMAAVSGSFIMRLFQKDAQQLNLLSLMIGTFAVAVCFVIPIVGPLVLLALYFITLGAIVDLLLKIKRT